MASMSSGSASFGQLLRRFRLAAGLTQQMLAERSGISVDAISGHENGRKRRPHGITVSMLADGLGLGPADREALAVAARCEGRPRRPGPAPLPLHAAVFLSHTSELQEHPPGRSFVAAAQAAAIRAGHVPIGMDTFAACNRDPADSCTASVARADVYVGIVGLRYGEPVRGRPDLSYTELEFETATVCGQPRLVFLIREDAGALPPARQEAEHRARQEAFRRRLQESGLTTAWVATPAELELRLYQALVELRAADGPGRATGGEAATVPAPRPPLLAPEPVCAACARPTRTLWPRRWRRGGTAGRPSRQLRVLPLVALLALSGVIGGLTIAPRIASGAVPLAAAALGPVSFVGTQAQPPAEYRAMEEKVLKGFGAYVDFDSQQTAAQDIQTILQEQASGVSTIGLIDMTDSDLLSLEASGALMDLTPLLQRLQKDRQFPQALLDLGRFGTDKQYYIPWLQATYLMVVNKKALQYLPKGVDPYHLTYDQLIAWGRSIEDATHQKMIGLPAELTAQGGMMHRFLQGYLYPSFTGTTLTGFRSPEAVEMWQTLRSLWDVTSSSSTTYASMEQPLLDEHVWIAWDHQARLEAALERPDQFIAVPAPSGPKGLGYMTAVVGLAIPRGAKNAAGAEALIDWLTRTPQQVAASSSLGFFPVVRPAGLAGPLALDYEVDVRYRASANPIETTLPSGLGSQTDAFTKVYQETFNRIVLQHEDIRTVLNAEGQHLQQIVDDARAPCWAPDPIGTGPCRIG